MSKPKAGVKGFVVVFGEDLTDEDAEAIRVGIADLQGVVSVTKIRTTADDLVALERARATLAQQLFNLLYYTE